jgi:glycosyltransferase involved in cell wall biosynthesis
LRIAALLVVLGVQETFSAGMKPTILLLTRALNSSSGWGTLGLEICRYFSHDFDVIALTEKDARNEPVCEQVFRTLPSFPKIFTTDVFRSLWALQGRKIDWIVCPVERLLPLAVLLKLWLRCKLMLIGAGTYIYRPFVTSRKRFILKFLLRFVDRLVVISHYTKKKVKEFYRGDVEVVTLGVDRERYFPIPNVQREQAFVFVGELKRRKGVSYLLQAFEKLVRELPECKLYLVGKHSPASIPELPNNVIATGEVSHQELLQYYSRAIAHVLPSVNTPHAFEGFGLVHLEANACGLPTIGSLDCGNEDAIAAGVSGFLCPQKDVECLYRKMKLLATDAELWATMSRNAIDYAKACSWSKAGERLGQLLNLK